MDVHGLLCAAVGMLSFYGFLVTFRLYGMSATSQRESDLRELLENAELKYGELESRLNESLNKSRDAHGEAQRVLNETAREETKSKEECRTLTKAYKIATELADARLQIIRDLQERLEDGENWFVDLVDIAARMRRGRKCGSEPKSDVQSNDNCGPAIGGRTEAGRCYSSGSNSGGDEGDRIQEFPDGRVLGNVFRFQDEFRGKCGNRKNSSQAPS